MEEKKVRRYLDDLLIRLEVFKEDPETLKQVGNLFADTINFYRKKYPSLIEEYHSLANKIFQN